MNLDYYKPTRNAWKAVSIACICAVAIVFFVCESDMSVNVKGAYDVEVKTGAGSQTIQVINVVEAKGPRA